MRLVRSPFDPNRYRSRSYHVRVSYPGSLAVRVMSAVITLALSGAVLRGLLGP